ncbi:hypothetical protein EUGRSUZ_D01953 [Eucalyptus grandis]|uniref:Uncharacterized protein n=2 Tax=Eucalyptus grandis TaxID=71139 RepID=A0ACC3L7G7_EUCGR|nr:hypothetical protein EUGRSUZ_D01953 [Eucalyptus grandis]
MSALDRSSDTTKVRASHGNAEMTLKVYLDFVKLLRGNGHAANMLTSGPMMSGFWIPGLSVLGPLEEKEATAGAVGFPVTVPLNTIVAVGYFVELIYDLIFYPAEKLT